MKTTKYVIILILITIITTVQSQQYYRFTGQVLSEEDNSPVAFYPVEIYVDTVFYSFFITNENGVYYDSVWLPQPEEVVLVVTDCNGIPITHQFDTLLPLNEHDFLICVDQSSCIAYYEYSNLTGNDLSVQFENHSIGNFNVTQWDFGDGTVSFEYNPLHTFPEEGYYFVSLIIYDSIQSTCFDTFSQLIEVGSPEECQADFEYWMDTLNPIPYVYHFENRSTGNFSMLEWDFGDGNTSNELNPTHTYLEGGNYMVSLLITDSSGFCQSYVASNLQTPAYYDFGGQAFLGDFPINIEPDDSSNIGIAYLYRKINNRWYFMDSREFWQLGFYWFVQKPEGDYLIQVELKDGSSDYNRYAPAYANDKINWIKADIFTLNDYFTDRSVYLRELPELAQGNGFINGHVDYIYNQKDPTNEKDEHDLIQLFDHQFKLLKYAYTDQWGNYSFERLPAGKYLIHPEVTGLCSSTLEVTIAAEGSTVNDANLTVYLCDTTGIITHDKEAFPVNIYPIPAHDKLHIAFTNHGENNRIVLIDMHGKTVFSKLYERQVAGELQLDVSGFPDGIYLLQINKPSNNQKVSKKIIIQH